MEKFAEKYGSGMLKYSGVKGFVDGVTSTYTGFLSKPYEDMPETCGLNVPITPQVEMQKYVTAANKAGLSVRLHCVADGAVHMALDMFEQSIKDNDGLTESIHNTIEHIENILPEDIPRFEKLDVIASMQPWHMILDQNEKVVRIGKERCRWEWPHRTLLDKGAKLAFGSDIPVVPLNPFPNIYAAVARKDFEGEPTGVNPEECITVAESLRAYTADSADAYGRSHELGTLEAGKLADITVVNKNIFDVTEQEMLDLKIDLTMVDGVVVYERKF